MSTWLGIDIGTTAVKACAIRTSYRRMTLVGLASIDVEGAGGLAEAIGTAARAAVGVSGTIDAIATSVEGARATMRVVRLPASAIKQVGEVLPFELESMLPFELEDAVFDHHLLSERSEVKGEELGAFVAVAKTEDVVARIDLVKGALGAEPERVGIGALPLANLVAFSPGLAEGVVAIVDLGTVSSDVLFLKAGEPVFARSVGIGMKGLPAIAAKLARELRTTLAAFRAQGGATPDRVLLCGGGAYEVGAEAFLSNALGVPVSVLPPPTMEMATLPPDVSSTMARFAKAIGLALGLGPRALGFNLRKGPLAFERGFAWVKEKVPLLAGLGAVILVSFVFSTWAKLHAASKEKDVLEAALSTVTKEVLNESTSDPERATELLSKQTVGADDDPMPHADAFDVMVKISEHVPPTMTHDIEELDVQKGHVVVHGIVGSIPDAQTIRSSLESERCVADPKITRTTAQVGSTMQKYVLEFDLRCPEDVKTTAKKTTPAPSTSASGGDK